MWTPWGPGDVSCIGRCPHFRGKFILRKLIWDIAKCPFYRSVLISRVSFKRGSLYIKRWDNAVVTNVLHKRLCV